MHIDLYVNYSDNKKVGKQLSLLKSVEGVVTGACTLESPQLLLRCDTYSTTANYCYIPEYGRFYYITGHTFNKGEQVIINCTVDVLQTYSNFIRGLTCTVLRQENEKPNKIVDGSLPISPEKRLRTIRFSDSPFNLNGANQSSFNFILNVAGGAGGTPDEVNNGTQ